MQNQIQAIETSASLMTFDETMRGLARIQTFVGEDLATVMDYLNMTRLVTGLSHAAIVKLALDNSHEKPGGCDG